MPVPDVSRLRLTFDEEFNTFSSAPDGATGTWMTSYPYSGSSARTLSGNSEAEFYADSSVGANPFSLSGGVLQITASPAPGGVNTGGLPYVSGLITTDTSFSQTYGYFEVRAWLPAGRGLWPAFWLLPASNNYTSELDVFEVLGDQPGLIYSSVHGAYGDTWATDIRGNAAPDTSDGFHVFGVDWEPDTTSFYMDGQLLSTAGTPDSMNSPMFMLLNLAVGGAGSWPGAPDASTAFPAAMKIDYVRAYATANTRDAGGSALVGAVAGAAVTLGAGPDVLTLSIAQDAWQGDARFTITVDGTQVGGVQTVTAASGAVQLFNILGSFGPGRHGVMVNFLNDAYGVGAGADRNLYVVAASLNRTALPGAGLSLFNDGRQAFSFAGSGAASPSANPVVPVTIGTGADSLALTMSEDAWLGDATFTVSVDGQQIGGTLTAAAAHGTAGQVFTVMGDFRPGLHVVRISLSNDAYGGTIDTDRNLYLDRASLNGIALPGATVAVTSGVQGFSFVATQSGTHDVVSLPSSPDQVRSPATVFAVPPKMVHSNDLLYSNATGPNHFIDLLNFEASYHDLMAAFGLNQSAMQTWYNQSEPAEGRIGTFDGLDYVASCPDLIAAFAPAGSLKAVQDKGAAHFIASGEAEGRTTTFNGLDYIASSRDLIKTFGANGDSGAYHFIETGSGEGRTTTFDGLNYIASYVDLIKVFGANEQAGAMHFISAGANEGRATTFGGLDYIARYPDLMTAFGANIDAGASHFINSGFSEGRSASPFDIRAYESAHPDLTGRFASNDAFLIAYIDTYKATGTLMT